MNEARVQVVDFFSGCGGTSVGFRDAGLDIVAGVDSDMYSAQTFRLNFPEATFFEQDIRRLNVTEVADVLSPGPVLFSGCAPCQPFSRQNKWRSLDDPRRTLLTAFSEFVLELDPTYVFVENVPGTQRVVDGPSPFRDFTDLLRSRGYDVAATVLRAGDFEVPQERRRLVIVASKVGPARLPEPAGGNSQSATVRQFIGHLPALVAGGVDVNDPDHAAMKLSELNVERIRHTPEGGGRSDWPEGLVLNCHRRHNGHSDVYGRMSWDKPASGLTTKCLSYSNGRFGHPEQDRAISAREAACLQTFPEDFRFCGPLTEKARQIGNAVPPIFARKVAEALVEQ